MSEKISYDDIIKYLPEENQNFYIDDELEMHDSIGFDIECGANIKFFYKKNKFYELLREKKFPQPELIEMIFPSGYFKVNNQPLNKNEARLLFELRDNDYIVDDWDIDTELFDKFKKQESYCFPLMGKYFVHQPPTNEQLRKLTIKDFEVVNAIRFDELINDSNDGIKFREGEIVYEKVGDETISINWKIGSSEIAKSLINGEKVFPEQIVLIYKNTRRLGFLINLQKNDGVYEPTLEIQNLTEEVNFRHNNLEFIVNKNKLEIRRLNERF